MARRKMDNAASTAMNIPRSSTTNIHNHPFISASTIFMGFCVIVLTFPLLWFVGVFVLSKMGVRHPDEALATGLVWLVSGGVILFGLQFVAGSLLQRVFEYRTTIKQLELDAARHRAITAQQPAEQSNGNSKLVRKLKLARMIMAEAYQFYADHDRNYQHNDRWPWAWRNCKGSTLYNDSDPVTEDEARGIRGFLEENRLIVGDQINLERYPDFAAVDTSLRRKYELPIIVNQSPTLRLNDGYSHIDGNR